MFETANRDHTIDKAAYRRQEPKLRQALLDAQYALLRDRRFSVLILIAGVEGAGKGETVNLLNEWMDPRHIQVSGFQLPTDEERQHPAMWRFWRALPPKGKIGIFFGAWHTMPILERVAGRLKRGLLAEQIAEILRLERMLVDEDVLLLKFWFHLSKAQQKRRLKELESKRTTRWRVGKPAWKLYRMHDRFAKVCEPFLEQTSTAEAPWLIVPGADARYRALTVGRRVLAALTARLAAPPPQARAARRPMPTPARGRNVIAALRLDQPLAKDDYEDKLEKWQGRLNGLARDPRFRKTAVVAAFEGNDAAGKGGAIRRVTGALDARYYETVAIAAPTEEERARPYLWRFWRHIPAPGRFALFDRSWYGRVLVERVEGFIGPAEARRAYGEINDFEHQLVRHGIVVAKFWLAIDKDEQLRRFKEREQISFKRFKITAEDWRNREKWDAYEAAVCDMVARTSTEAAPWTLVEANNKDFARIKILKTLSRAIANRLDRIGDEGE